jgi:hypothetical protein
MKFQSLFALVLTLATIGLSLPAEAGDRKGHHNRHDSGHDNSHKSRHNYYGKYHYYQIKGGDYIYIGSKGDYWDSSKEYHPDTRENDYEKYYDSSYDYNKGNYYYQGRYYSSKH